MSLSTPIPLGWVFVATVATFAIGLLLGWLSQQGLDRVLRHVAVRRARRNASAAQAPEIEPVTTGLTPWYVERPGAVTRPVTAPAGPARPGMPFYRNPNGGA